MERNPALTKFVQKHPTQSQNNHPPEAFFLLNMQNMQHLSLGGEFTHVVLENMPVLSYLSLKFNWARIKLRSWTYRRLNLIKLETFVD